MVSISQVVSSLRQGVDVVSDDNSGFTISVFPGIIPPLRFRLRPNSRILDGSRVLDDERMFESYFMRGENLDDEQIIPRIFNSIKKVMDMYQPTLVIGPNITYRWKFGNGEWQTSTADVAIDRDSGQAIPNPPNMTLLSFERTYIGVFKNVSSGEIVRYRLKPVLPTDENIVIGEVNRCSDLWKWTLWIE
jgi:hypothetical protein